MNTAFALAGFAVGLLFLLRKTSKENLASPTTGPKKYRSLTLSAALILMLAVGAAMYFMHTIIGLSPAYWIVPVFGALGGLVGSLIRNANHLTLVTFDPESCRIRLGFIGDVILGLGGAAVVSFLFENTLNFDPAKPASYPLMISVCFVAGVFGQLLIEIAGEKVIAKEALSIAQKAGKETEALKTSSADAFVVASLYKFDKELYGEALEAANDALALNPTNVKAVVAKGRALKKLGNVKEALSTVDKALKQSDLKLTDQNRGVLLYNKACYLLLVNPTGTEEALGFLEQALALRPSAKEKAPQDEDLRGIWTDPKFLQLTGQAQRPI